MLSPPSGPGTIPGYDFSEPTEAHAVAALGRVFGAGAAEVRWQLACRAAGLEPGRVSPGDELARAAAELAAAGGAAAMVARSIEIRMRTYARLAALARAAHAGGPR